MTTQELRELNAWIAKHVMGWIPWTEEEYPYRDGFSMGEYGEKRLECDMPEYTTDPAAAMDVLKKCAESKPTDSSSIRIDRVVQLWTVSATYHRDQIFQESETLELAIAKFSKLLFSLDYEVGPCPLCAEAQDRENIEKDFMRKIKDLEESVKSLTQEVALLEQGQ